MDQVFEGAARALQAGEIDFGEFAGRASKWTERKARWLLRTYGSVPAWLDAEDVAQTLLLHLWRASVCYDGARAAGATTIERYLAFSASRTTQKMIQRAQAVNQHTRRGPKLFEMVGGADDVGASCSTEAPGSPDADAIRRERYAILRELCGTARERFVVEALERGGGTLAGAAQELWADRRARLACELVDEAHGERIVASVVRRLIEDYGNQAA